MTAEDNGIFLWLGRLIWTGFILAAIAITCLAIWGLCATAAALDHGETWAQWVAGTLFTVAFLVVFREIHKG